jgi:hypothetical protein
MKLDYLKEKKELLPGVLLVASAFLAVLALIKVTAFFVASARAENIVEQAIEQSNTDDKSTEEYFAESTKLADELKKNNLFAPPPPKQHPVKEVWGIFGDQALIKDKWYDVGDKVGNAKIVAIGATSVKIEWDGKEKAFAPIDAKGSSQPGGPKGARAKARGGEPGKGSAQMVAVGSERFRGMGERFQNMSEAERDRFRAEMQVRRAEQDREILRNIQERWPTLSEQEREKLTAIKEKWPSMSEKKREGVRAALRKRFGG